MSRCANVFAYAVTGNTHIDQVNTSLRFLKRFTRQEVVVVAARYDNTIEHDQVIRVDVPEEFDNHQASIVLKTGLHRIVNVGERICCYIDSDVVAVHEGVQRIFQRKRGPVTFAADHTRLSKFSRFAVRCSCTSGSCDHLREAIASKFGVVVSDQNWQHWNGGVFLFDSESTDFLDTWHSSTLSIFKDPKWKTRDQGTLVATVWKFGLQDQLTLAPKYNYIVDGMRGLSDAMRKEATPSSYRYDETYSLDPDSARLHPYLLHFVNGTGQPGWRNWDEAEARLYTA
ncbi:glycosyltransferase family protein [Granulicella aggregans]|uniref:hypothetical protein n=1 Tax=Granulicella aggregans TaxID=474949 RepID=UPI0021E0870C|nr:hypothetical protein [Granulicella aggregans]